MPRRRAIDARDLDDATRQRLGIASGSPETRPAPRAKGAARDERAIAQKRQHTGKVFEADLAVTHRLYELKLWGKLWPHSPPFVYVRGQWLPRAGGGPVDYTGHVCLLRHGNGVDCVGSPNGVVVPVAFDAKVCDGHTYRHAAKQRHQLLQLREAAAADVTAFLLVHAVPIDRLFALDIESHAEALLMGKGVRLYEHRDWMENGRRTTKVDTLLPSIERGTTPAIPGWDWIPLIGWMT